MWLILHCAINTVLHFLNLYQAFQHHCMCARHIKRAIEEFNIKLPKRLEEKEEKKTVLQYNCQVCNFICICNLFVNIQELSSLVLISIKV